MRITLGSLMRPSAVSTTAVPAAASFSCCSLYWGMIPPGGMPTTPEIRARAQSWSRAAMATRASCTMSVVTWRVMASARMAVFTARPASSWFWLRTEVTPRKAGVSPVDRSTSRWATRLTRWGSSYLPRRRSSMKRRMMTTAEA